jgi:hypothetical protein
VHLVVRLYDPGRPDRLKQAINDFALPLADRYAAAETY